MTAHRRAGGSSHPPRAHPGDERRQLPPQGQPAGRRRRARVGPVSRRLAPRGRQRRTVVNAGAPPSPGPSGTAPAFLTCAGIEFYPPSPAHQGQRIHQHLNALGVPFGPPHQPVQLASPHRMQSPVQARGRLFVPVHRSAFAHHVAVRRKPPGVDRVGVAAIQPRLREPSIQPQEGRFAAVAHLKIHPPTAVGFGHYCGPDPPLLPLLTMPGSPIGPHLIAGHHYRRTLTGGALNPLRTPPPQPTQGLPPPFFTQPSTAGAL